MICDWKPILFLSSSFFNYYKKTTGTFVEKHTQLDLWLLEVGFIVWQPLTFLRLVKDKRFIFEGFVLSCFNKDTHNLIQQSLLTESFFTNISHQLDFIVTFETALEHKFKRWFCTQKLVLNVRFNDFWYTKIQLLR